MGSRQRCCRAGGCCRMMDLYSLAYLSMCSRRDREHACIARVFVSWRMTTCVSRCRRSSLLCSCTCHPRYPPAVSCPPHTCSTLTMLCVTIALLVLCQGLTQARHLSGPLARDFRALCCAAECDALHHLPRQHLVAGDIPACKST